jgi:ATP-binding cassette, subfamily B (MDR/TAP), member 1
VRFESLRRMLRQEIAFFDTPEHSTGKLTNTLSTDATAMSGLSGNNLASLLTFVVDLTSVIIVAIAFAWKLGLVGLSVLPVQILCGYFKFSMQNKLTLELRQSYAQSANVACEQVAAIRTVAALNREERVIEDFVASLEAPVHAAMIKTMRSTLVYSFRWSF